MMSDVTMSDDMFRPEKECPELPDPDNGQVHLTGRNFQVSDNVTFLTSMIILTFPPGSRRVHL